MDDKDRAQASLVQAKTKFDQPIRAGQVYRHYKGGLYVILALAIKEDTLEPLVVYQSNAKGSIWARTLENFTEDLWFDGVPGQIVRFSKETD